MEAGEIGAYAIFGGYFVLILLSFTAVFHSIFKDVRIGQVFEGKAFLFLRTALGALLCTWYFMIKFMLWSYQDWAKKAASPTMGRWLLETKLFEQAWSVVCDGLSSWWWSSFICTWTVLWTAILWREAARRDIALPAAYMLLGMLVAISVATSLFIVAVILHPRKQHDHTARNAPVMLWAPLAAALYFIYLIPSSVGTGAFSTYLLLMHFVLFAAIAMPPNRRATDHLDRTMLEIPFWVCYGAVAFGAAWLHYDNTRVLLSSLSGLKRQNVLEHLWQHVFHHPAQGSISLDVVWTAATVTLWWICSGDLLSIIAKTAFASLLGGLVAARYLGVNWGFILSVAPIVLLLLFGVTMGALHRLRAGNAAKRRAMLESLGIVEDGVVPGTVDAPPTQSGQKVVVGFWHPYCNSGGGGERVLWSAIKYLQKTDRDVVCVVYSGDCPAATKEQIMAKVKDRFEIDLSPATLHFVPLRARHLISDGYWRHFTLLGQSFGSVVLALQGLCGAEGLWGDIFIDSMGYAFTLPLVKLLTAGQVAIGSYVHYPTVSADMVKRVRARAEGVENAGASKSWLKTQVKLLYYRIFTSLYSVSLLFSETIMTNSSWTQAHIKSLLAAGRSSGLAAVFLLDEKSRTKAQERGEMVGEVAACQVVYPPCDTAAFVAAKLDGRRRELVSLAQFRPEKDHAKQIHAMAHLFEQHPECRSGDRQVRLVMMGGARDEADEKRLEGLRALATKLDLQDNVEFVVNAPYPTVIKRLGEASIGLNSMQDEHFGINVVEFMAAALIPIVHASAGPLMDIVVPYEGQRTGFHATTAEEFASAIHDALTLPPAEQKKMREAARKLAVQKFSLEEFERGFARGWQALRDIALERRHRRELAEADDKGGHKAVTATQRRGPTREDRRSRKTA